MNAISTIYGAQSAVRNRPTGLGQGQRLAVQGMVATCDGAAVYLAVFVSCLLHDVAFTHGTMDFAALLPPLTVGIAIVSGAYQGRVLLAPLASAARGVRAMLYAAAAVMFVFFAIKATQDLSRIASLFGVVLGACGLATCRMIIAIRVRGTCNAVAERILLIEDGSRCADVKWACRAEVRAMGLEPDADDPVMLTRIGDLMHRMDRVVVCCPEDRRERWAAVLTSFDARGEIIDAQVDRLGVIGAGRVGNRGTLVVAAHPLAPHHRIVKRGFDIVASVLGLVALSPVFAVVALAILREDRGPVFFWQDRLGQGNRTFRMLKFRSMRADQCDAAANRLTSRDDPRVTRVGQFIRATSIDELPQLINVLTGQMSIVGPRPHAPMAKAGTKLYWQVDRRYWERHALKPGLTGLAQVRGHRGATDHEDHLRARLQADLEYRNGWSIWRDFRIVLATIRVLIHPKAY
ncbi:sugar transferase [Croceicoccus gelatinilyticus]|uniref:sugar transferase n=1 Tax=Croceicoccus gelatinilyticus TaxID=2835536 RepID=UPI001BCB99ED|nr:sugar transferase [Croceicoccus gelatinilyticus]MBS7670797.1 sugar transferase [Croceicoccus gelatinilyticus]